MKRTKDYRPRLNSFENNLINEYRNSKESKVLVVGDTHFPFDIPQYLDFLKDTYDKYNCNRVVHIGDCVDFHALSYHESDPNGMSAGDELSLAKRHLQRYYKVFPDMDVLFGNHSRLVSRKAMTSGIPREWVKSYAEVFEVPNWNYHTELVIDNVLYTHGDKSGKARTAAKRDMISTVTGHYHTDQYVEWFYGKNSAVFAMAVGSGINDKSYGMAYASGGKKSAISCGVVLDAGETPICLRMPLEKYKEDSKYPLI
jgi:predicted phosphodiesterase